MTRFILAKFTLICLLKIRWPGNELAGDDE